MAIRLQVKGFNELLQEIEAANGSMIKACESALKQSAATMQSELKKEMQASGVPSDLVNAMPPFEVKTEGNRVRASVGYKKGTYNPQNLSDGYKVVFLNYGTPHRRKHGKIEDGGKINLGFIERAKKIARPKIKKQQKAAFEKIIMRLKK